MQNTKNYIISNKGLSDRYSEEEVIAANKKVYNENAKSYDQIVLTKSSHRRLEKILSNLFNVLKKQNMINEDFLVLDACGGTGMASIIINKMGLKTHLVDLSSEMIRKFDEYCTKMGFDIKSHNSEINRFLKDNDVKYDLIVFSSALHHLRYPEKVLINAANNLKPGGMILSISDPTTNIQRPIFKILSLVDRAFNHLLKKPIELIKIISKKIANKIGSNNSDKKQVVDDWVAEIHAQEGIDDYLLKEQLKENKLTILWHKRYTGGYTKIFQIIYKMLKFETSFSMIISNDNRLASKLDFEIS